MNAEMKSLLEATDIWVLATADGGGMPNAVPLYYTKVMDDGRLVLVDNFMKKTITNIKTNPNVSVSVWRERTGYQFKGKAHIETAGPLFEMGKSMVKDMIPKGVVVVDVDEIYSTSPGPEAGNRIP